MPNIRNFPFFVGFRRSHEKVALNSICFGETNSHTHTRDMLLLVKNTCHHTKTCPLSIIYLKLNFYKFF